MNYRRLSGALPLLLLFAAAAAAQERPAPAPAPSPQPQPSKVFREARRTSQSVPPAFEFELSGFTYQINGNGAGRRIKGGQTRRFNLRLDGGDYIERLSFTEYRDNVLLLCGVTDGESGAGFIVRLEQPSMRSRWKRHIAAFNVGAGLIEDEHVYLTGISFVARLDLRTGEYVWKHEKLERGGGGDFNSFEVPEVRSDAVLFREKPTGKSPARTVSVNRKTGKINGIE
ncbi:MAG: PQQ-like beta-propeller repeat protein [Acidobacteria bacterium]|nr:PQQ-like beta-propeller repeat protein [Acidobacteriota bacterium]